MYNKVTQLYIYTYILFIVGYYKIQIFSVSFTFAYFAPLFSDFRVDGGVGLEFLGFVVLGLPLLQLTTNHSITFFKNNFCKGCLASGEREIKLLENILSMFKKKKRLLLIQVVNSWGRLLKGCSINHSLVQLPKDFRGCDPPEKGHS